MHVCKKQIKEFKNLVDEYTEFANSGEQFKNFS